MFNSENLPFYLENLFGFLREFQLIFGKILIFLLLNFKDSQKMICFQRFEKGKILFFFFFFVEDFLKITSKKETSLKGPLKKK